MNERDVEIYRMALGQMPDGSTHSVALALVEADACLGELTRRGRYPHDAAQDERDADRLALALELLRARRKGVEAGLRLRSWWQETAEREPSERACEPGG